MMMGKGFLGVWGGAGVVVLVGFLCSFSTVVGKNRICMIRLGWNVLPFE
jgi:hypothetical protein